MYDIEISNTMAKRKRSTIMYKTLHSKLKVKQHIPYLLKTGDEIGYSRLLLDIPYNITAGLALCDRLRFSHM